MAGAANTEGVSPQINGKAGKLANVLQSFKNRFFQSRPETVISQPAIQPEQVPQIPPDSGYAKWIERIEGQKTAPVDLTANELRKLYPHFTKALKNPNLKVTEEERNDLSRSLNDGKEEVIIRLAKFIKSDYLKGKNIDEVKKRNFRHLGDPKITVYPLELEAILADQLVARLKLQSNQVPSGIISSTQDINLDPDTRPVSKLPLLQK